ncbi:MAG: DedA family protein, partial [Chloroflexi bacterium]|nr:DedA family protein [Chloroflexota bacterium]
MVDWWTEVRLGAQGLLEQHGMLAGFLFVLIEEAGVPVPVPGDFIMLLLGVQARQGRVALWEVLVLLEGATLVGASFLYLVSRRAGRALVYQYGRYIHLTPPRLDRAERWVRERGVVAVVLGRVIPGLRVATAVTAGIFEMPFWQFFPALALGAFLYILFYAMLGYIFGPTVLGLLERVQLPLGLLGSLVPLLLILFWIVRARRSLRPDPSLPTGPLEPHHQLRDGAIAGGLATIVSTLFVNVVIHLAGDLALMSPGALIERTAARLEVFALARAAGPLLFVLVVPAFFVVGVLWGMVYARWVEPRFEWPDWLEGLLFSLIPLAVALVVVIPSIQLTRPGFGIDLVATFGETI